MFDVAEREALRSRILRRAQDDPAIAACALVGSTARGEEDAWSDLDIALGVVAGADPAGVAAEWTTWLRATEAVADTLDVWASGALYRVFVLESSLQVDLSFWPAGALRATGGPIRVVFGDVGEADPEASVDTMAIARKGWLFALHARSALARGRWWQAELMIAELRGGVISLACAREGLDPWHGRDAHRLPVAITTGLERSRATDLGPAELARSLRATLALYRTELAEVNRPLSASLAPVLATLADHLDGDPPG